MFLQNKAGCFPKIYQLHFEIKGKLKGLSNKFFGSNLGANDDFVVDETPGSAAHRKRAATNPLNRRPRKLTE